MRRFQAKRYEEGIMVLENSQAIEDLTKAIDDNEDFILEWKDDKGIDKAELIIANNVSGKVKTGDIKIISMGGRK